MTLRIPEPNFADRFLRLLGKSRAVQFPTNMGKFGKHFQVLGVKESFWKALTRPKSKGLPEGTIDIFMVKNLKIKGPE